MKKRLSFLSLFLIAGFTCHAQLDKPVQTDTLIVKNVKYNKMEIDKENWPFKVIYRYPDKFVFGDKEFEVLEPKTQKRRSDKDGCLILADMSSTNGGLHKLLYKKKSKDKVYVEFSGYEITCRNRKGGWQIDELDEMPSFMGGSPNLFSKWVNTQLVYPEDARQRDVQGRVILQFTIQTDGSVTDVTVLRSVDFFLDREAVRVVSSSPKWSPGKIGGKPVIVTFTYPVIFQLR